MAIRTGKFKKRLADEASLEHEAPLLAPRFAALKERHARRELGDAQFAILWCLIYLHVRYQKLAWGAHRRDALLATGKSWPRLCELAELSWEEDFLRRYPTLDALLNHRAFRATPEAVHRTLLNWEEGHYPLILMERIPSVQEVLAQQVQGRRCVTLLTREDQLARFVLGERDPLGFGMHDLIHADHFFHNNQLRQGQIGFYRQLKTLLDAGAFSPWLAREGFEERLEYLAADMNSHPLHLWKCLKAILEISNKDAALEALEQGGFAQVLGQSIDVPSQALSLLNRESFRIPLEGVHLTNWCESWGSWPKHCSSMTGIS